MFAVCVLGTTLVSGKGFSGVSKMELVKGALEPREAQCFCDRGWEPEETAGHATEQGKEASWRTRHLDWALKRCAVQKAEQGGRDFRVTLARGGLSPERLGVCVYLFPHFHPLGQGRNSGRPLSQNRRQIRAWGLGLGFWPEGTWVSREASSPGEHLGESQGKPEL